jgi:N-acetyl-alpha-D-muramate 1-phosphate uridylyltransferase
MILAAGRGERLRPLTDHMPKPLLPIGTEPLIVHQVRWLAAAGIRDIVVNLHHLGEQIEQCLGGGNTLGVSIRYSHEPTLLETGGGIQKALPLLGEAPFVILNGDIWTDYPLARLPSTLGGDMAHLVLTQTPANRQEGDFGLVGTRVTRGAERPYTYCGIALIAPALFDAAPAAPFSLRVLFFEAIARGRIGGELWSGQWTDIGTPDQLDAVRRAVRLQSPYNARP